MTPAGITTLVSDEQPSNADLPIEVTLSGNDASMKDSKNRAIGYGLSNKENYYVFLDDAAVPITNNRAEQTMRKATLKRIGSMFSTSMKGAEATCPILTVIQTTCLNRLCPDRYVKCLLENYAELNDKRTAKKYLP